MTVRELIERYLRKEGYDGLAGDECGCGLENLMPCDTPLNCVPGHAVPFGCSVPGHAVPCDCGQCMHHYLPGKAEGVRPQAPDQTPPAKDRLALALYDALENMTKAALLTREPGAHPYPNNAAVCLGTASRTIEPLLEEMANMKLPPSATDQATTEKQEAH